MFGIPITAETVGGAVLLATVLLTAMATGALIAAACAVARAIVHRVRARRQNLTVAELRLLDELDTHLDNYLADNPDIEDGLNRLQAAVREHQREDQ
ncbi:hypothetical protein SAMN04490357_0988 [Streptomyces misionensis]|uniref:Uncharacterized protein n=1 Tax=Streptomyces misionensis TaxID=67331 RepID=A0A1H4P4Y6_9ACTN|nr:hypothetical protein [Streptomyces misionensis]SEC02365.1 hypothetical protein SAMN04490357_0988 [Streptomyces misionensis]